MISVEHRFFGKSQPLSPLSPDNLKYLNSRQALADLASFIDWYQLKLDAEARAAGLDAGRNTWINVGGSYPGALSAWFRLKYPTKTVGAISSSGVVHAIQSYTRACSVPASRAAGGSAAS